MNKAFTYFYDVLFVPTFLLAVLFFSACASTGTKPLTPDQHKSESKESEAISGQAEKINISQFILGVGDTIEISVYRHDDLKKSLKIDSSGMIMFPLIGDVRAAGKGVFELRDEIQRNLSKYLIGAQVTISVTAVQSQKIMVLGEVGNPGILTLDSQLNVMEAISKSGGMTDDAKLSNVLLIRRGKEKAEVYSLNLKKAFKNGDLSQNKILQSGDIVYLPAVTIANVSWYFSHLSKILSPIVLLESGIVLWPQVENVLNGTSDSQTTIIPTR